MNSEPSTMNPYNQPLQFVTTADGSKTIFNAAVGENYHSRHGALQESRHVFLNTGLFHWLDVNKKSSVSVLEVGFGTGLNFLLTADYCTQNEIQLDYTGIEAFPLSQQMISQTGYKAYVSAAIWQSFTDGYSESFTKKTGIDNSAVQLQIASCKLTDFTSAQLYNVIYYDAFAAAYQPEMWTDEVINNTARYLELGGVFVTYAITGNLKRLFKSLGFKVEKAPGAAGKREMLRATAG